MHAHLSMCVRFYPLPDLSLTELRTHQPARVSVGPRSSCGDKCCQDRRAKSRQSFRSACESNGYSSKKPPWEAGILPLNYARGQQNRRYHAIIEGYASRSRVSTGGWVHRAVFRRLDTVSGSQLRTNRQISARCSWATRISGRPAACHWIARGVPRGGASPSRIPTNCRSVGCRFASLHS